MVVSESNQPYMKTINLTTVLIITTILITSCSKDSNTSPGPAFDYTPMNVGNYWVYQRFDIDSAGNGTSTSVFDSVYIEKDTVTVAGTYYKMIAPDPFSSVPVVSYIKDSLTYLVDINGNILFSSFDFTTIFSESIIPGPNNDTIAYITRKMEDKNVSIVTPAGTFTTSDSRVTYFMGDGWTFAGSPRLRHHKYAPNIGLVVETLPFYVSMPTYVERRIVRYKVN
jgi:hypothetical protein